MKISILDSFELTKRLYRDKIAIIDNETQISFKELDSYSDSIALSILKSSSSTKSPVGVYLSKSRWSIVSFLGVVKSGNFYVPLDINSPLERTGKILDTLKNEVIICDRQNVPRLLSVGFTGTIILIEDAIKSDICESERVLLSKIRFSTIDLDPIYAIFTSGSTGTPKGVLISHRGVSDYIEWAIETYEISSEEIIGNQAPFHFDNSTLDIFLMLSAGSTLIIIPEDKFAFPIKLVEYLNEKSINFVFWVPSVLNSVAIFDAFSSILPTSLKKVLFAGEVMPTKHLNYWMKKHPNAVYSNLYGPTEITVDCTFYIVNRSFSDNDLLPIGRPCKNTQIIVLSEEGKLVSKGEIGELCVRGSSLAFGYYNDNLRTKEAFVQNPLHNLYPDIIYKTGDLVFENEYGEYVFVGRKDSQVKHLGFRIELGEIEAALLGIKEIENACVLYDDISRQIVAFYIGDVTLRDIRVKLLKELPKYMVPTKWYRELNFPFNANGKIDRIELQKRYQ